MTSFRKLRLSIKIVIVRILIQSVEMAECQILQVLNLHAGEVTSCDFNSNYLLAVGCSNKKITVMEWKPGLGFVDMHYSPLTSHKYGVTSVKFSTKGVMLASSSLDGTAVLHDVQSGNKIFVMVQTNATSIRCCQFTPDSTKLITSGDDGIFCFWDLITRTQIRSCLFYEEEEISLKDIAVSSDSEFLLSVDSKGSLKLWSIGMIKTEEPKCVFTQENIHDSIFSCDFSPIWDIVGSKHQYVIATSGADGLVNIMNIEVERICLDEYSKHISCSLTTIHSLKGHENEVFHVKFNPTGEILASTGLDHTIKLWQASIGLCFQTLKGHTRFGTCSAFTKDSVLLATGSNDKTVIIWSLQINFNLDNELVQSCDVASHFTNVNLVSFFDKQIHKEQNTYNGSNFIESQKINLLSTVHSVHMHGNNMLMVTGGGKTLGLWKKEKSEFVQEPTNILQNHKYGANYSEISPCGTKIISCSIDGVIIFWNLNMGLSHDMKTPNCENRLRICCFSPNLDFIAAGGDDQKVFLWDASSLEFLWTMQEHEEAVTSLAFTPDSEYLVSGCAGGDIKLFSFKDNKCTAIIKEAHDLGVMGCDISLGTVSKYESTEIYSTSIKTLYKDNYLMASCGNDCLVKLWQIKHSEFQLVKVLSGHGGTVHCVKFAKLDPFMLASCSADRTVRIWAVKPGMCIQVLNLHENFVTTCSFSEDSSILVTGSLDKTIRIWTLTENLSPSLINIIQNSSSELNTNDNKIWFGQNDLPTIAERINDDYVNSEKLFAVTERTEKYNSPLLSLKIKNLNGVLAGSIPHKFLCPISHDIMEDPVVCSDGYTYDRKAIIEWYLSGKVASPITSEHLKTLKLLSNTTIKTNICKFLLEENVQAP